MISFILSFMTRLDEARLCRCDDASSSDQRPRQIRDIRLRDDVFMISKLDTYTKMS